MAEELTSKQSNVFDDPNGDESLEGAGRDYKVVNGTEKKETINSVVGDPNWINAGAGNDVIYGKNAYDMLAGNDGNDKIDATKATGSVEMYGGEGKDTLYASAHGDWVAGNEGKDYIKGGKGHDTLLGGDHDKSVDDENDTILGGAGNDLIKGGLGADVITGGIGQNTLIHHEGDGNDIINLTKGENLLLKVDVAYSIELSANKKDVLIYTKDDLSEYITIKNLGSKDVTNNATKNTVDESSVLLQEGGNEPIDLRTFVYEIEPEKNYTGTWLNEDIDATNYIAYNKKGEEILNNKKGLSLNGGLGDDIIAGSKYNDTITGGVGNNVINIDLNKDFGNDTIVLTKNENLEINITGAEQYGASFLKQYSTSVDGKDFIVKFYSDVEQTTELGSIRLKNFVAKNVVGDNGSVVINVDGYASFDLTKEVFKMINPNKGELVVDPDMRMIQYDTEEGITSWVKKGVINGTRLGEVIDASGVEDAYGKNDKGVTINAGAGDDIVGGSIHADKISGGDGNDVLYGNVGDDTIYGGNGNDSLVGEDGYDKLYGGSGNDTLYGEAGVDYLFGDADNDELYGGNDNDELYGGNDNDYLDGGSGDDLINGGKGNDILLGGEGKDTFVFVKKDGADVVKDATSEDVIKFADRTSFAGLTFEQVKDADGNLTADLVIYDKYNKITIKNYFVKDDNGEWVMSDNAVTQFALKKGVYTLEWKESNVYGEGMYNVSSSVNEKKGTVTSVAGIKNWIDAGEYDKVTGAYAGDMLAGNQGNDVISASTVKGDVEIFGGEGCDSLTGGAGNDWIAGNEDNDYIKGGKGNDILLGGDHETKKEGSGDDTIYGGDGKDSIYGGDGADKLYGDKGDDYVVGGDGADTIYGGDGADTIYGGDGADTIYGGAGNDEIIASGENSVVYGDTGNDEITAFGKNSVVYGGDGNDEITAFGENSVVYGGDGNDDITLMDKNQKVAYGEKGNDYLSLEYGLATISGGVGNDTIEGGFVDDSDIVFAKGDGKDLYQYRGAMYICDKESDEKLNGDYDVNAETLVFEDSSITDLSFAQKGDNLVITYGKNSTVTVENYYKFLGKTDTEQLKFVYRNGNIAHYITGSEHWKIYIQTQEGKGLLTDALKADIAAWQTSNGASDVVANATTDAEQQAINLASILEDTTAQALV